MKEMFYLLSTKWGTKGTMKPRALAESYINESKGW